MAKVSLTTITSRYASVDALNANFEALEEALENTLSRDGSAPNAMGADLDMDSNRILNLPTPTTAGEPIPLSWAVANYADFQTVAGLDDEIEALAAIVTEIVGVYGGLANIATVASGIANVNAVGSNISSVNTVATNISNVNNVNTNIADVSTVASNIASVNTTAGAISNVNTVAGSIASVNTVSGISSDVTAVALINGDVTTVSGISSDVTAVASDATDIGTVATNIANVNTVAGISGNVTTVAGDSANVTTVAGNIANVNTVAGISADVTTAAGNSTNITTVAGINSAVSTVAANNTNVSTVATNISDVIDVATNIADVQAAVASAAAAATSASNAATSESNAATSASNALTSEGNASTSATNAAASALAASNAQAAAEAAQEAIDGLYLGAQASDPTLDNNGNPVTAGDWYYNTTTAVTRIYDGSIWQNGAVSTAGFLQTSNNLSDLGDAPTARTNLGLGTAATTASTDYATAAQGTLADSAIQPGDNISTLTNNSGYLTGITGESIENLSDVNVMTPTDGQILMWDNSNSRWDAGSSSAFKYLGSYQVTTAGFGNAFITSPLTTSITESWFSTYSELKLRIVAKMVGAYSQCYLILRFLNSSPSLIAMDYFKTYTQQTTGASYAYQTLTQANTQITLYTNAMYYMATVDLTITSGDSTTAIASSGSRHTQFVAETYGNTLNSYGALWQKTYGIADTRSASVDTNTIANLQLYNGYTTNTFNLTRFDIEVYGK